MKRIIMILAIAPLFSFGQETWRDRDPEQFFVNPVSVSRIDGSFYYLPSSDTFSYGAELFHYYVGITEEVAISALFKYQSFDVTDSEELDYMSFQVMQGVSYFPWRRGANVQIASSVLLGFKTYFSEPIIEIDTINRFGNEIITKHRYDKGSTTVAIRVFESVSYKDKWFLEYIQDVYINPKSEKLLDYWLSAKISYRPNRLDFGVMYEHKRGGGLFVQYRLPFWYVGGALLEGRVLLYDSSLPNIGVRLRITIF